MEQEQVHTDANINELSRKWREGLDLAEYAMIKDKAQRGDSLLMTDNQGGTVRVPAKELLRIIYGESDN